jgi:hypothetical protein
MDRALVFLDVGGAHEKVAGRNSREVG